MSLAFQKDNFQLYVLRLSSHVEMKLFNSDIYDTNLSNSSFKGVVKLKVCVNIKSFIFVFLVKINELNS